MKIKNVLFDATGTFGDNNHVVIAEREQMGDLCCVKECDRPVAARCLCARHYAMNKKYGTPVPEKTPFDHEAAARVRFWKHIRKIDGGCWLWDAGCDIQGYGRFKASVLGVRVNKPHRYSYILHTGHLIEPHVMILHSCHNPPCCNPDHLRAGTASENAKDRASAGGFAASQKRRFMQIAKLSDDDVRSILKDARPYADIALACGVHPQTIMAIKGRYTRYDVDIDPAQIVHNKRGARGTARSKTLTDEDVRVIRASNIGPTKIGTQYGISPQTVCDIRAHRSWKHVE